MVFHNNFFKTKRSLFVSLVCLLFFGFFFLIPHASANGIPIILVCNKTTNIPTIDGNITLSEWNDAIRYKVFFTPTSNHYADYINFLFKHNETHFFAAWDVEGDNTSDAFDNVFLYFDLDNNGTKDLAIGLERSGYSIIEQYPPLEEISLNQWKCSFGFGSSPYESRNHTQAELIIAINRSVSYSGQDLNDTDQLPFGQRPLGVIFSGYGTLSPEYFFGNNIPCDSSLIYQLNASFYADMYLGPYESGGAPIPSFTATLFVFSLLAAIAITSLFRRQPLKHQLPP